MLEKPKPFGLALGIVGNVLIGVAMYRLLTAVGCTANLDTLGQCTSDITSSVPLLPAGIVISTIAVFAGGRGIAFLGTFLAVGIGALAASFNAHDSFIPSFGKMFGGIFVAVSLLLIFLWITGASWGRRKLEQAQNLMATGAHGTGTYLNIRDTGMYVNDNPRVEMTVQVQPDDGSAPFTVSKREVISRYAFPQIGSTFDVWYDRNDPSQWVSGSSAQMGVQSVLGMGAPAMAAAAAPAAAAAAAAAAAPAPAAADSLDELSKLNELRLKGALSDAEFESAKKRILSS